MTTEKNERRIARLCWNDNGWVLPSGRYGKSKHEGSHEAVYGYGHEEWLFDTSKLIDGYHYGFLEPVNKQQNKYKNNFYDVWLYTIDGNTKKRYWIGEIKNLQALDATFSDDIKAEYAKRGWLAEMEEQVKASGANAHGFSNWQGVDLFNVRFHPKDATLNDPYFKIPSSNPVCQISRYSFVFFKEEFSILKRQSGSFEFKSSTQIDDQDDDDQPKTKTYTREARVVELTGLHKAISKSLTKKLRQQYGAVNVVREHSTGDGASLIDIVVRDKNDLIFYEIKTYSVLRTSIREAVGQIMEYAYWPDQQKASRLIVITQPHNDFNKVGIYFKHLRETFNIPIYYQSYDIENNELSELV